MPSCPMAMPSSTAMVLNSLALPPAFSISHHLAEILEMHMARDKLGKAVGDGDDGLAEIAVLHASRTPQAAGAGHVAAVSGGAGAVGGHGVASLTFGVGRGAFGPMGLALVGWTGQRWPQKAECGAGDLLAGLLGG